MEAYLLEWLSLLGRWAHMIVGIAWIGASFYFIWLDNHLEPPKHSADVQQGVGGEIWSVHGGGFYHAQKYKVAPPELPENLHWFKWEAYTTWITGIFMMALLYWYQAEIYLIDPSVMKLSKPMAVAIGVSVIVFGWLIYDFLCRSKLGQSYYGLAFVLLILFTLLAWVLCQIYSGRGAFIHYGAMLGTIMVGNVAFVIMPGQRDLVAAKEQGRPPDPIHGERAKQRSVHNTYFTLPVLFVMISNHYAMTYAHQFNWAILMGFTFAGGLIRVYFVQRHKGNASILNLLGAAGILMAIAAVIAPSAIPAKSISTASSEETALLFSKAHEVVLERCTPCHATSPTQPGFAAAPKGVVLETEEHTQAQALTIYQQAVLSKAMPIGNLTQMTDEERGTLADWFNALPTSK